MNPTPKKQPEIYALVQLVSEYELYQFAVTRERRGQPDLIAKFFEQTDAEEYRNFKNGKEKA
jgi:hypothetical protein